MPNYVRHVVTYHEPKFSPTQILAQLRHEHPGDGFLFDLTNPHPDHSDHLIYLGLHPLHRIIYQDGVITTDGHQHTEKLQPYLERLLAQYHFETTNQPLPFSGGLVGYLAYDYSRELVPQVPVTANPLGFAEAAFLVFTEVIGFNPQTHEVTLIQNLPAGEPETLADLRQELDRLQAAGPTSPKLHLTQPLQPRFDQATYTELIDQVVDHIYRGDIFQLILANPLQGQVRGDLLALYQELAGHYHCYLSCGDLQMATASPETLLRKTGNHLATFPLAGTRRRGRDAETDKQMAHELLTDPKEHAEHNMLVDLGRNDLGAVSQFNSVRVNEHMQLHKYQQVMHLASTVESEIAPEKSALDALQAVFPAGTLSGAPKSSALKIIAQLEQQRRGLYGGTFGYLDFNGDCDFAIGIRLAQQKGPQLLVQSGAGIVADSIGSHEYQECFNKTRVIRKALARATQQEVLSDDFTD
ncbi:anthranilate synthase component I family protein [Fructilactobacillus myrtifloralis]|uniref:Anthranilate synthase component 1 n=1 Tax=Fructilactobacillus myrtifloralis TaxID=2940301 RepID=A0ABY5BPF9_9LACO|nr:anthranilate synthase component I family protein [Fructilactobacillus myrtifloralis]USS85589.1 anthranilate synthase component I family protein [Fructilactobacillus myrtifloralis]